MIVVGQPPNDENQSPLVISREGILIVPKQDKTHKFVTVEYRQTHIFHKLCTKQP